MILFFWLLLLVGVIMAIVFLADLAWKVARSVSVATVAVIACALSPIAGAVMFWISGSSWWAWLLLPGIIFL